MQEIYNSLNIKGLIKKINSMSDNKEKYHLYNVILWTLSYFYNINIYNDNDLDSFLETMIDTKKVKNIYLTSKKNELIDIYKNVQTLNSLYKPILLKNKSYSFYMQGYLNINFDKLIRVSEDFFKMIDNNLFKLYEKLLSKNLIYEKYKHDKYGSCGYINGDLSGIILDVDLQNLYKVITLVHEMDHAFDNYLNKTHDKLSYEINTEVTAMTFEYLFIYFLLMNNICNQTEINICNQNYFTDYLLRMNNAYIYNKLFIEKKLSSNNNNNTLSISDLENIGIIHNNLAKEYLQDINVFTNYYGIGLLFASVFMEHFIKDNQNTIKEIKDFSCLTRNLNTKEILSYFSKTELINAANKNIHKALSKKY